MNLVLRTAGARGPFGDAATCEVEDPVAALDALASARAGSVNRVFYLPQPIHYGAKGHIQGLTFLTSSRGRRCFALCASTGSSGKLVFAEVAGDGGLSYRRSADITDMNHPSGFGAWNDLLAVVYDDDTLDARLRIYRDPVETTQVVHTDQLVFEPLGGRKTSKCSWLAWTRLVCGRYFALVGAQEFGREHGWAVLYDPSTSGSRFSIPALYTNRAQQRPRVAFEGGRFGDVQCASFLSGSDGTLYLMAIETQGARWGVGTLKLFRVDSGDANAPVVLRQLKTREISSQGNTSFRWGSCVFVNGARGLTAMCSERGAGNNVSLYEVGGPPA